MNAMIEKELGELAALIQSRRQGRLTPQEFRAHSVHYGVYTQRQPDLHFVRVRVPQGVISPAQLSQLATAIETAGRSECHLTTRQGVEVHGLTLDQIGPLLRNLAGVDLFSHETGGNSIRSIMVCPHAGVGTEAPFDVTPCAELLTRQFVRHPDFQALPRKMKIAFSCCEQDCVRSFAQDLGFQARRSSSGEPGFRVLVGGGTGALPRLGQELTDFLPLGQMCLFTEAFLRMFNRLGDRTNRGRARVKFLVQALGLPAFRQEIARERTALEQEGRSYPAPSEVTEPPGGCEVADTEFADQPGAAHTAFSAWAAVQTQPQPQPGFRTVRISLAGGSVAVDQLRRLAELSGRFGWPIRTTPEQGFLLRWVPEPGLFALYRELIAARLSDRLAVSRMVVCPGSTDCSNAFTNTPALAQAIAARLAALPGGADALGRLRLRLSGCPNGCGFHASADIGLEGVASRKQTDWVPAYRVWVGGRESQRQPRFGDPLGLVPARHVPELVADLAAHYLATRQGDESFADCLERVGSESFAALVHKHRLEAAPDHRALTTDWGETGQYIPRGAKAGGVC